MSKGTRILNEHVFDLADREWRLLCGSPTTATLRIPMKKYFTSTWNICYFKEGVDAYQWSK